MSVKELDLSKFPRIVYLTAGNKINARFKDNRNDELRNRIEPGATFQGFFGFLGGIA